MREEKDKQIQSFSPAKPRNFCPSYAHFRNTVAVGPSIADSENPGTNRRTRAPRRPPEDPATTLRYRGITDDQKRGKMTLEWLSTEESDKGIIQ